MGRLSIDVTAREHQQIKTLAALQGKTIREYAIEKLLQPFSVPITGEQMTAWQEFGILAKERIAEADNEEFSTRSFDDIFDLVLTGMKKA
ncbi:MAG: antitoxin [Pseudomonadota bacterium]